MLIATYIKGDKTPTIHRHLQVGKAPITTGKNLRRLQGTVKFSDDEYLQAWLRYNEEHIDEKLCEWYDYAGVCSEADIFGNETDRELEFDIIVTDTDKDVDMFGNYSLNVQLECLLEWLMDDTDEAVGYIDGKRKNYEPVKAVNDK